MGLKDVIARLDQVIDRLDEEIARQTNGQGSAA